jgi:4,5-dihydroxyphthalate decarboxylase
MHTPATPVPINLCTLRFDRTAPLIDGRVRIPGVNVIAVPGGRVGVEGFLSGAFDAADIPFARYVLWKSQGMPITAVPVFTDRFFQHEYIYTRPDTGIGDLRDLRGRRVMCAPSYYSTPSFWHRALLRDDAGIEPHEIEWFSAFPEPDGARVPVNVRITFCPASMLGLEPLLDGTVDALMTARTAYLPLGEEGQVQRVIPDTAQRLREWVRRTGSFPIAHVLALHDKVLKSRPTLSFELCAAFDEAKNLAYRILQDERMTALPMMRSYLDDTVALWGVDPWPYGAEKNREQIDRFLTYAFEQGLTPRRLAIEELFDAEAWAFPFRARMQPGCITSVMDGGWALEATPAPKTCDP